MVVRSQHLLLSRRLLWHPWLSPLVADPAVHGVEGRPDRRRIHAYGMGAVGLGIRHPAATGAGAGFCRDHGVRVRLHASAPGDVFRGSDLARHAEGEGLAASSGGSAKKAFSQQLFEYRTDEESISCKSIVQFFAGAMPTSETTSH